MRRALLLIGSVLIVLTWLPVRVAAGELYADLDRDGVRDVVSIQNGSARGLLVWLSTSKSTFRLSTRLPILNVTTADIDGDGALDLVAADTSAKLHIWRRSAKGRFRPFHPRSRSSTAGPARGRGVEDPPDSAPPAVVSASSDVPFDSLHPPHAFLLALNLAPRPPSDAAVETTALSSRQPRAPPPAQS